MFWHWHGISIEGKIWQGWLTLKYYSSNIDKEKYKMLGIERQKPGFLLAIVFLRLVLQWIFRYMSCFLRRDLIVAWSQYISFRFLLYQIPNIYNWKSNFSQYWWSTSWIDNGPKYLWIYIFLPFPRIELDFGNFCFDWGQGKVLVFLCPSGVLSSSSPQWQTSFFDLRTDLPPVNQTKDQKY